MSRLLTIIAHIALCVAVYFFSYANPILYNSDTLFAEDLYRSIYIKGDPLSSWTFSTASYWLDFALYFTLRLLTGNLHQALALFAALQCTFASSVLYLLGSTLYSREWKLYSALIIPIICYQFATLTGLGSILLTIHIHTFAYLGAIATFYLTTISILQERKTQIILWGVVALSTANDKLYILWSTIPLSLYWAWKYFNINHRTTALKNITIIGTATLVGKLLDIYFRVPSHGTINPNYHISKVIALFPDLLAIFAHYLSSPHTLWMFCIGALSLTLAHRKAATRQLTQLHLLAIGITTLVILAHGYLESRYFMPLFLSPILVGISLAPTLRPLQNKLFSEAAVACSVIYLSLTYQLPALQEPYYPVTTKFIDEYATQTGRTTGLASYWDARFNSMLSQKDVVLLPIEGYNFAPALQITNRDYFSQKATFIVHNSKDDAYYAINKSIVNALNGPAASVTTCSTAPNYTIETFSRDLALATTEEYVLRGDAITGEDTSQDLTLWKGTKDLDQLTLLKIRMVWRDKHRWCVLHFSQTTEELYGKTLSIALTGNKAQGLTVYLAKLLNQSPNQWVDKLMVYAFPKLMITASQSNTVAAEGGTIVYFKVPNRHSTKWPFFQINHGQQHFRLSVAEEKP